MCSALRQLRYGTRWPVTPAVRIDRVSDRALTAGYEHPGGPLASAFAERMQAREEAELSPLATRSYPPRRLWPETDCGLRTPFQRDRDRIVHSKAFRRLKHKTQVFVA